jgi:hypothetical protein
MPHSLARIIVGKGYRAHHPCQYSSQVVYQHHQHYQYFAYNQAYYKGYVQVAEQVGYRGPVDGPKKDETQPTEQCNRYIPSNNACAPIG